MIVNMIIVALAVQGAMDTPVRFQAHRGGLGEYPEGTMTAYRASWALGALPEIDVRTTQDGIIICLHDKTLARTSNAPAPDKDAPVSKLTLEAIRKWDIGERFAPQFAGEKVPALEEVFKEMKGHPEREVYLDLKDVNLDQLAALIKQYEVVKQIIFCHNVQDNCAAMREKVPGLRTMLWIGGKPEEIRAAFKAAVDSGFRGLDQVQLHLHEVEGSSDIAYQLPADFLREALAQTGAAKVDLEVLPFKFDDASLAVLLDLGIRWYATDNPKRFRESVNRWEKR